MTRHARQNALEYEFLREQAGALGVAGRQLREALAAHAAHVAQGGLAGEPRTEQLLDEVAGRLYALVLQRELLGFVHGNVEWIDQALDLPPGIWSRIGATPR